MPLRLGGDETVELDLCPSRPYALPVPEITLSPALGEYAYPYVEEADRDWNRRVAHQPHLWRGPVLNVVAATLDDRVLQLSFDVSDFGRYLYEQDQVERASTVHLLYVSAVVQTGDGHILLVEQADITSAPGLVQLPGGNVDPTDLVSSTEEDLVRAALRELSEEVGDLPCERDHSVPTLIAVSSSSVGVLVPVVTSLGAEAVRRAFAASRSSTALEVAAVHLLPGWHDLDRLAQRPRHPNLNLVAVARGCKLTED